MAQFAYLCDEESDAAAFRGDALATTVSLFGEAEALSRLSGDARAAGLNVRSARPLESVLDADGLVLGDIVAVDCPSLEGGRLAALVRLDERVARPGAQMVVSTTGILLEDVFGCLELARAQILVDPTPAGRVLALGSALVRVSHNRVGEIDQTDRLALLRLTEEVGRLATQIDRLTMPLSADFPDAITHRLAALGLGYRGGDGRPLAPQPDPRMVHRIIRQRRLRDRYFANQLFADPAWDILLDLTAARAEHRRVSVTSLCIAAAVPATTALRWIAQMTEMGILVREQDEEDRRRAFIALSDKAADAMARYFNELGKDVAKLI